jgi:cellobiose phosphorylase
VRCRFGDWNDSLTGIDLDGTGESVWTSMGIVYGLKVGAEIAERVRNDPGIAGELRERARRLTASIHDEAWDGEWFIRAINDLGERIGSKDNTEGAIWLLPQVWAVLAGIVDEGTAETLFASIERRLDTPYGFKTLHPAYTAFQERVGRVTAMAPGMWENGTPYCHATGFKIFADCAAGRGDQALQTYMKVMPDNDGNPSTHSGCEPYAFTNQYIGPDNPRAGETQFAWMTGAGGWFFRAMTEGILGVRADFDGLLIDPCLPAAWKSCRLSRWFRNARYEVEIQNPEGLQSGRVELLVDGHAVEGAHAPLFADGQTHTVEARIYSKN